MSYFDDQEEAWYDNDCKGSLDQYNPYDPDSWPKYHPGPMDGLREMRAAAPKLTKSQKRNRQRRRAMAAKKVAGTP